MQQDIRESGLKSLNPMYYWKYVMGGYKRACPEVRLIDYALGTTAFVKLVHKYPYVRFSVESENVPGEIPVFFPTVKYVWRSGMLPEHRLKALQNTDYFLSDNGLLSLEAELCGVKRIGIKDLQDGMDLKVLESVDRINNWEKAKTYLDSLK